MSQGAGLEERRRWEVVRSLDTQDFATFSSLVFSLSLLCSSIIFLGICRIAQQQGRAFLFPSSELRHQHLFNYYLKPACERGSVGTFPIYQWKYCKTESEWWRPGSGVNPDRSAAACPRGHETVLPLNRDFLIGRFWCQISRFNSVLLNVISGVHLSLNPALKCSPWL